MRRDLDLADLLADLDYDPDPEPRRVCRHCQYGRHPDCVWDRCGCHCNNTHDDDEE